jgi:hypothetical protein
MCPWKGALLDAVWWRSWCWRWMCDDHSKCQVTLTQRHIVSSQGPWSFSKTAVRTSDLTSYRWLFFPQEWHSIAVWHQLQWNRIKMKQNVYCVCKNCPLILLFQMLATSFGLNRPSSGQYL